MQRSPLSGLIGMLTVSFLPVQAQTVDWRIDSGDSFANFSVRHLVVATVRGKFGGLAGTVRYDPKNPTAASVEATIECSTLDTSDSKRDADVKSDMFLDVKNHPKMTFKSTKVEVVGPGKLKVSGNLTIKTVTRPVILEVDGPHGPVKDQMGDQRMGIVATTKIDRREFGLTYNKLVDSIAIVGNEITIEIDAELVRAKQ